ncbi:hypothetical protein IJH23_02350 [Candidatus Saccharibacteria bacterium]|nr:hypothetical protein [Candidatus Saccharibacteria bacterium]
MQSKIKIAFLVIAHSNEGQLNLFINQLLEYDNSYVFVHLDKKSTLEKDQILSHERVIILEERVNVSWGDYSYIKVVKMLLNYASEYADFDYYSLHSGVDLMIKPVQALVDFLKKDGRDAYLEVEKMPISGTKRCGHMERIGLYYPRFMRKKYRYKSFMRYLRSAYMSTYKYLVFPKLDDSIYWFGSSFFTISKKMLGDYYAFLSSNADYDKHFYNSLCGDEIYFNTIFMNSRNCDIARDNNLFFIKWSTVEVYAGSPHTLTMADKKSLLYCNAFFARKFNEDVDNRIIQFFAKKSKCSEMAEGRTRRAEA